MNFNINIEKKREPIGVLKFGACFGNKNASKRYFKHQHWGIKGYKFVKLADTTVSSPASFEYQTKETAPANIQDRFGISETQDPAVISAVPKKQLTTLNEFQIYVVDGEYIRDKIDSDFDQGGNWMAYPEFVPVNEIWIDSKDTIDEVPYVIMHECYEAKMMTEGKIYSNGKDGAHDIAKAAEDEARKGMVEENTNPIGMDFDPAVPGEMKIDPNVPESGVANHFPISMK